MRSSSSTRATEATGVIPASLASRDPGRVAPRYYGGVDVCTYLFFEGDCQDAIELYVRVLGAELQHLSRFNEAPEFLRPPDGEHLIFHATLKIGSTIINLSDDPAKERRSFGGFALLIHLDTEEDVDRLSQGLTQGGRLRVAPVKTMWARRYAVVSDRFGVVWKLQCS